MINAKRVLATLAALAAMALLNSMAHAAGSYGPGASDTEIKIGNIMPYSGNVSAFGVIGKAEAAYFGKINAEGGINGRKVNFISYDDGYSPPRAVEQARKLVESDEVLFIFNPLGTPSNVAIQKYMNQKKVPQLFVASGAARWGDPKNFPWTIGWQPSYQSEARIYARYILDKFPIGKIGILSGTDDAAKDWNKGIRDELGDKASMIIASQTYEPTDTTVDSQIIALKNSGADILIVWATPRTTAQAIRKVADIGWKPTFIIANPATSIAAVLKPAGPVNGIGIISTTYLKDPADPRWKNDAGVAAWAAFMDKYYSDGDKANANNVYGYAIAQTLVQVLKQCGDDLTRENVMRQAANLQAVTGDMLLPGIAIKTSPSDFNPIKQMQMMRFDGTAWQLFGPIIQGGDTH